MFLCETCGILLENDSDFCPTCDSTIGIVRLRYAKEIKQADKNDSGNYKIKG